MNGYVKSYSDITIPVLKTIFIGGDVDLTDHVDPKEPKLADVGQIARQNPVCDGEGNSIIPSVCMNLLMFWATKNKHNRRNFAKCRQHITGVILL